MIKRCINLLSCFLLSVQFMGASKLVFMKPANVNGLPDPFVQSAMKDKYGYMWFSTLNGLSKYDGYGFTNYTTVQLGTYNNNIEQTSEDAGGNLWVKTPKAILLYDRDRDSLRSDLAFVLGKYRIKQGIDNLFVDADKNLWCSAAGTLQFYDFRSRRLKTARIPARLQAVQLQASGNDAYLLMSDNALYRVNRQTMTLRQMAAVNLKEGFKKCMLLDSSGRLWIYARHTRGLFCYDTRNREMACWPWLDALRHEMITAVCEDAEGRIWVGTDNHGIFVAGFTSSSLRQFTHDISDPYSLPHNHVSSLYIDETGLLWVGMSKAGFARASLFGQPFEPRSFGLEADVNSIVEAADGSVWFGMDGQGIARYGKAADSYVFYTKGGGRIPSDVILCSFRDSKGRVWFGTYGDGAFYVHGGAFVSPSGLPAHLYVSSIAEDAKGTMWFGTSTEGVFSLSAGGALRKYDMGNSALKTNTVTSLAVAAPGVIYVGTGVGLFRLGSGGAVVGRLKDKDGSVFLGEGLVNAVVTDGAHCVWAGMRDGISVYDTGNGMTYRLTEKEGLSDNDIRAMAWDKKGNLWVATRSGIDRITVKHAKSGRKEFECHSCFVNDGMGRMAVNLRSVACLENGQVLFGGMDGYLAVTPSAVKRDIAQRQLLFTHLYMGNRLVRVGEKGTGGNVILKKSLQTQGGLVLDHDAGNFTLEVSAMDYSAQNSLRYLYQLNGDGRWIAVDGNRITFNKLAPGRYRLEVKAAEAAASGRYLPAVLDIRIRPPFWQSAWAVAFYCLLLIAAAYFLVGRYKRNLRREIKEAVMAENAEAIKLVSKVTRLVEEHLDDAEYSVEQLSKDAGMSRAHLYKKLMAVTGSAPLEFVRSIRITRGKDLMDKHGETNISQVAYQVGLSPKQFSKYFKEKYGELPSEYIKKGIAEG